MRRKLTIDGVDHYQCRKCDEWLPKSGFYRLTNPMSVCGINSECRKCMNRRRRSLVSRAKAKALANVAAFIASLQEVA